MFSMTFSGVIAYPVTPLLPGGGLDLDSLERSVAQLAHSGVSGIVVLGTSGLFAYLDPQERAQVVRTAVDAASGSGTPVGVGISAITTREVMQFAYSAENNGADGLVLSPVSYIPLVSQEIADQVETVASAVSLPLCLYNNPTTTGFTYPVELASELSWLDNVVAFKDTAASGRLFHSRQLLFAQQAEPGTVHGVSRGRGVAQRHGGVARARVRGLPPRRRGGPRGRRRRLERRAASPHAPHESGTAPVGALRVGGGVRCAHERSPPPPAAHSVPQQAAALGRRGAAALVRTLGDLRRRISSVPRDQRTVCAGVARAASSAGSSMGAAYSWVSCAR